MKKQIAIMLLLTISATAFGQTDPPSQSFTSTDYLQKSKKQKTAAWIFLGTGTALITTALAIGLNDAAEALVSVLVLEPKSPPNTSEILFWTGLATATGSIPLFIASGKNKRKGMSLSFKNETVPQLLRQSFVYKSVPSLSLKINL
jgi:phosphate/sulfate permease